MSQAGNIQQYYIVAYYPTLSTPINYKSTYKLTACVQPFTYTQENNYT